MSNLDKFKKGIMNILENIEKHVLFVQKRDTEREVIKQIIMITAAHRPMIFIVSGISSAANIVQKCELKLVELLVDYKLEKMSFGDKENLFFKRVIPE